MEWNMVYLSKPSHISLLYNLTKVVRLSIANLLLKSLLKIELHFFLLQLWVLVTRCVHDFTVYYLSEHSNIR